MPAAGLCGLLEIAEEMDLFDLGGVTVRWKSLLLRNWKSSLNAMGNGSTFVSTRGVGFGAGAAQAVVAENAARRMNARSFIGVNETGTASLCQLSGCLFRGRRLPRNCSA